MIEVAKIRVYETFAKVRELKQIPSGLVGATIRVEYDKAWRGLNKTIVFKGAVTKDVFSEEEEVVIPWECLTEPGKRLQVGFMGTDGEKNEVITTVYADLGRIVHGTDPSGDVSSDPTYPYWIPVGTKLPQGGKSGQCLVKSSDSDYDLAWDDYTLPDADIAEIARKAAEMVDVPGGGNVDLTGYATEDWVREGFQPKGNYATVDQIPSVPVQSVNGKTGAVKLSAADVAARPSDWMPSAQDVGALPVTYTPPNQTAEQVGADPRGTAATAVSGHNVSTDAHGDIRSELQKIAARLNAFLDVDDQTMDELSEVIALISSNKTLIDAITTSKVSVTDIINNLTTNVANKPLSAAQGVVLKGLIDGLSGSLSNYQPKGDYALASAIPTKVSQLNNDKEYLTQHQDISHLLPRTELDAAIDDALEEASASGAFDGADGQRGTGILNTTTGISSYTTAVGGVTPAYRILLSTLKTQSKVGKVLVGDTVRYSYYVYPVIYVDDSYAYMGTRVSIRGAGGSAGTSVTVKSVTESGESGGSNVVTFSDNSTITVKNGKDGKTPVAGIDYNTPADQEAIVQQVILALGTPVFGTVDADKNITLSIDHLSDGVYTLGYEDKDGNWVEICTLNKAAEPTYTNVLPLAINSDGTPYNGGQGWKTGTRLNSSGAESTSSATDVEVTGFIPVKSGDVIYLKNVTMNVASEKANQTYFWLYDANFTKLTDRYTLFSQYNTSGYGISADIANKYVETDTGDVNGNITMIKVDDNAYITYTNNGNTKGNINDVAYFRISCEGISADSIITVNEPIV